MSKDKDKKEKEETTATEAAEETTEAADEVIEEAKAEGGNEAAEEKVVDVDAQIEAAVADMKGRYLRLQADFTNFKRRSDTEKKQLSEVVKMEVLANILPVIDNFERALQVPQDTLSVELKSFVDGYAMIYKQLTAVLEKEGVTKIDAVGKPFDPNYHQAVMRVPSDEYDDDIVVEVLQDGYLLGDKTLRPAMVKVAFNG